VLLIRKHRLADRLELLASDHSDALLEYLAEFRSRTGCAIGGLNVRFEYESVAVETFLGKVTNHVGHKTTRTGSVTIDDDE
jgi:hypothetical protein